MPTTQPRYTVTDTGEVRDMLDLAQRRWPDVHDRRQLLLRLAASGADHIASELDGAAFGEQRGRQLDAVRRASTLLDAEVLLSDAAWRSSSEA
jgi:hypothetical protein